MYETASSIILIVFFLCSMAFPSPVTIGNNGYGHPLLLLYNPSLIAKQYGISIGCDVQYNQKKQLLISRTGFYQTLTNSAFSFVYKHDNTHFDHTLSTAFSSFYQQLGFGSSCHFLLFEKELLFSLDIGASYHFEKERFYIGLKAKNLFTTDTTHDDLKREFSVSHGGTVPLSGDCNYTLDGIVTMYNLKNRLFDYGTQVSLEKRFFKNPYLSLYGFGKIVRTESSTIEWHGGGLIGYNQLLPRFSFGLYGGYDYYSMVDNNTMVLSFYINPLYTKKIPSLDCTLDYSTSVITPNGDAIDDYVLLSLTGTYKNKYVTIKRWTILIYKGPIEDKELIGIFTGGNIPPSSIRWEGRNMKGEMCENGTYTIQPLLIDSMNRMVAGKSICVIIE